MTFESALRFASVSPCVYTSKVIRLLAFRRSSRIVFTSLPFFEEGAERMSEGVTVHVFADIDLHRRRAHVINHRGVGPVGGARHGCRERRTPSCHRRGTE